MRMDFERPTFRSVKSLSSSLESALGSALVPTPVTPPIQPNVTPTDIRPSQPLPQFDKATNLNGEARRAATPAAQRHRSVISTDPLANVTAQLLKHVPLIRLGAELVSAALISLIFLLVLKALLLTLIGEGL